MIEKCAQVVSKLIHQIFPSFLKNIRHIAETLALIQCQARAGNAVRLKSISTPNVSRLFFAVECSAIKKQTLNKQGDRDSFHLLMYSNFIIGGSYGCKNIYSP
jgi:hypothetical protein